MNRVIPFFSYEQCYKHYTKRIMSIRQAKIHGEVIVAKPVLLVAIIDGIDANVFRNNQFTINDWLEGRYNMLMSQYAKNSQFDDKTTIGKPFWHLETDGLSVIKSTSRQNPRQRHRKNSSLIWKHH